MAKQQLDDTLKKGSRRFDDLSHLGSDNYWQERGEHILRSSYFSKHTEMHFLSVGVTACTSHHLRNMILHFISTVQASLLILR